MRSRAHIAAGIVQQPTTFNPLINAKKSQERRDLVLDRMQALGMATPDQVKAAKPVGVNLNTPAAAEAALRTFWRLAEAWHLSAGEQQVLLGADRRTGAWRYGASLLHAGERFDDAANTRLLAPYSTLDLYADWQVAKDWSLQAKVNNLTDRQYETSYGYNQPGRAVYLTLRWQPK